MFCYLALSPVVLFSYYNLEDISHEVINKYLSNLVERSLRDLECSYCIEIKEVCKCKEMAKIKFQRRYYF